MNHLEDIDSLIDDCLHPERNGLLIKKGVAEGANHEWLVKKELRQAIDTLILRGKIEEIKLARSVDSQFSSADIVNHLENRLAELEALTKEGE